MFVKKINAMKMILTEKKNDIILRDYQKEAVSFINSNNGGKLVLAMCPSSGKTETIIYYLNEQYNLNPNLKVLILPHSTNVLLDNFYQRLESRNVDFTYSSDVNDDVNVHVILPQNHNRIVGHYDLIIIDEAHENYLAKTIQGIIKKTQAGKEILLTGTPSKFIGNNDFKLHFVALSDLCELYTPKLRIDIIESDYDWNGNYNTSKEIKSSYKFSKESTEISLKKTFDFLLKRNDSDSVEKTLIVCRNIAQSNYVKEYLTSIGFSSEISNSDNDKDSENVSKFKNNLIDILIVVNRARLGYDDADLINLIDISGTLNPNIIYQMFARLLRGTQDMKKYYIRLSSKNDDVYNSEIATSVALMLTHTNYIQVFNGKNFNAQDIIVNSEFFIKSKKSLDKSSGKSKNLSKRKLFIDVQEDDSFDVINFFKEVIEQKEKNVGLYKFCKVSNVLNELKENKKNHTLESCKEIASKYNSRMEWQKNDIKSYASARYNGWLDECCANMIVLRKKHTLKSCREIASKYKNRKEWQKNDNGSYQYAYKNGWLDECCANMIVLLKKRTLESCKEIASKYNSRNEWKNNDCATYSYARTYNWLDECMPTNKTIIKHTLESCMESASKYKTRMEWQKNDEKSYSYAKKRKGWLDKCYANMIVLLNKHTLESCMESASKYKTRMEWQKNDSKSYASARYNGWLDKCCANMVSLLNKYSLESCIESASKYKTKKEWRENDSGSYQVAYKNGWLDKCCANMIFLLKKRTLESCKEIASKYRTKIEWRKNDNASYVYAQKNGWLDECCANMIVLRKKHTLETCIEDARKYATKKDWRKNSPTIYGYAINKKWMNECCANMEKMNKSRTKEECVEDSRKYESSKSWKKNSPTIYGYAVYKKWLQEIKSLVFNQ
jgi:superfamily II DNA or RNA helicase